MIEARRILSATTVLLAALFVLTAGPQLAALIRLQPDCPRTLFRGSDGFGYYAWLRSPLIDGDLEFSDEYYESQKRWNYTAQLPGVTANGLTGNFWSVGPAVVWAVPVALTHGVVNLTGLFPANGYSPPYQVMAAFATFAFGLLGLWWIYLIAREFAAPIPAAVTAAVMTTGTMIAYYFSVETSFAHGPATTAFAGFLLLWLRSRNHPSLLRWMLVGVALGFAATFRWQLLTFAVIPALDALAFTMKREATIKQLLFRGMAGVTGLLIGFAPQMLGWYLLTGELFSDPHQAQKHWLAPDFFQVLFTNQRGYFTWTPAAGLAFAALCIAAARNRPGCRVLLIGVFLQIYAVASIIGTSVFLGGAFGFRILTETTVALVPGIAIAFDAAFRRSAFTKHLTVVLASLLILGNLLLMGMYRFSLGAYGGDTPVVMLRSFGDYIVKRPLDAAIVLGLAAVLLRQIGQAFRGNANSEAGLGFRLRLFRNAR